MALKHQNWYILRNENLLIQLYHGLVFPPVFKVAGKLYYNPPDFFTNFTRLSAHSFNKHNSLLSSQAFSHPEVDNWWHAQLTWHLEFVAATMFAPLSFVHGTFSASSPA